MEWPTPGLCPGVVGRNASTYSSKDLKTWWRGFAVLPTFFMVGLALTVSPSGLNNKSILSSLFFSFKLLPSEKTSASWEKTSSISRKNKHLHLKLAIARASERERCSYELGYNAVGKKLWLD
ncbi:hypothetical protein V6N13_052593 [Hibiscus sabdariffa]|uniref:Uncharacterized protein n=2 Tax=Hibiscus sabdariffa TaxID=183260 RepID=A0ABR2Q5F4_9ROSI